MTLYTFEWLLFLMNTSCMCVQSILMSKRKFENFTFEWLFIVMNSSSVCIQSTLNPKTNLANFTFEWLLIFMNTSYVCIQMILASKKLWHISHLNGFWFWWTLLVWVPLYVYSKYPYVQKKVCKFHIWMAFHCDSKYVYSKCVYSK